MALFTTFKSLPTLFISLQSCANQDYSCSTTGGHWEKLETNRHRDPYCNFFFLFSGFQFLHYPCGRPPPMRSLFSRTAGNGAFVSKTEEFFFLVARSVPCAPQQCEPQGNSNCSWLLIDGTFSQKNAAGRPAPSVVA